MSGTPYANRIDPTWSAEKVRRILTDEPGPGMGAPFSDQDVRLFQRACGLTKPELAKNEADPQLLERMYQWCMTH